MNVSLQTSERSCFAWVTAGGTLASRWNNLGFNASRPKLLYSVCGFLGKNTRTKRLYPIKRIIIVIIVAITKCSNLIGS